jgi:hypothetical protein
MWFLPALWGWERTEDFCCPLGCSKEYRGRLVHYDPCLSGDGRNEFLFASFDSSEILMKEEKDDDGYLRKKKTFFWS